MKEKIKILMAAIFAVIILACVSTAVYGQDTPVPTSLPTPTLPHPTSPPTVGPVVTPAMLRVLQSPDAARNWALAHVARGTRSVDSASMDWDYSQRVTDTNVLGNGAEDVLDKLFAGEFKYRLMNPADKITGRIWLYDNDFNLLFAGEALYTVADAEKGEVQYNIWLQNIPLFGNVESAEIIALAEDNTTGNKNRLEISRNGQLLFPPWNAGAVNGLLGVKFKDGSLLTFPLAKPTAIEPQPTQEAASQWKIEGHYVYTASPSAKVVKIIETWVLPTVYLEVAASEIVTIDVLGLVQMKGGSTVFERPGAFTFTQQDGPWSGGGPLNFSTPQLPQIAFPAAGKYRIQFEWVNFGKPNYIYAGPQEIFPVDGGEGSVP